MVRPRGASQGVGIGGVAPSLTGHSPISGMYYGGHCTVNSGSAAPGFNTESASRFDLARTTAFDRIALNVTVGAASNVFRLGIRRDNGSCYPAEAVLLDAGTIDASTTGLKAIIIALTLGGGRYWLSATLQGGTGASASHRQLDPAIAADGVSPSGGYISTVGASGALPSAFGGPLALAGNSPNNVPYVILRAA